MASSEPPAISTPSRPRYSLNPKRSGTLSTATDAPNVAGFSPGGQVFEGYSYLSRSTSMTTSTRSRPRGLQSRPSDFGLITSPSPTSSRNPPSSPTSPQVQLPSFTHTLDLPKRSKTLHLPSSSSTPEPPPASVHPWRSKTETERLARAVANLPHNPKLWLPSQVAIYLTHVLGLVPIPVVDDVTAYVRASRMGGRAFLRLSEKDLERQGLNLKWRMLMIEAVRKLRRDALRGRIWGYESGSLRWPKTAREVEREEAEDDESGDDPDEAPQVDTARNSMTTSKLTLKRMRDSKKVRGMIQAFQTSPTSDNAPLAVHSIDAGYAQGFVRDQAQAILSEAEERKLSLRRPLRPRRSTADFPWLEHAATKKEDVEAMLASLTEQEALELAKELDLDDLQDTEVVCQALQATEETQAHQGREGSSESANVMLMPTLSRHNSADSTSVDGDSSISCSDAEIDSDLAQEDTFDKPRYGVLDEEVIRAILAGEDHTHTDGDLPASSKTSLDGLESQLIRSHTTTSIVRPSRPYRASLYTDDELADLDTVQVHMRTESSLELAQALSTSDVAEKIIELDFGTARLRSEGSGLPLPDFEAEASLQEGPLQQAPSNDIAAAKVEDGDEYIFVPPDETFRKTGSIQRTIGRKATFGSKRGKAVLSLLNSDRDPFASLSGAAMLRQKSNATAEEEWGGTLGRSSSRKGLTGVFDGAAFPERALDQVASEEEEVLQAKMQVIDVGVGERGEAEMPTKRYEEMVLLDTKQGISVDDSLSSTLKGGMVIDATDKAGLATTPAECLAGKKEDDKIQVQNVDEAQVPEDDQPIEVGEVMVAQEIVSTEVLTSTEPSMSEVFIFEAEQVTPSAAPSPDSNARPIAEEPVLLSAPSETFLDQPQEVLAGIGAITAAGTPAAVPIEPISEIGEGASFDLEPSPTSPRNFLETAVTSPAEPQLLVPLTQLEPHPSGTGSIKKRSMVLVDRKKFESLARRMTHLEAQLDSYGRKATVKASTGLKDMFATPTEEEEPQEEEENRALDDIFCTAANVAVTPGALGHTEASEVKKSNTSSQETGRGEGEGWRWSKPSSWASYLSSLNPYYSQPSAPSASELKAPEEELDLYALLGRHESEHERHMLSIGAIPAYMLGLGAGVGFVLVKEVLGRH